jgi:hypothetical protein
MTLSGVSASPGTSESYRMLNRAPFDSALPDVRGLHLLSLGGLGLVAGVFPFPPPAQPIELFPERAALRRVRGLLEISLEVLLPLALGCGGHRNVGTVVVAEGSIPATPQLKFDVVALDLHLGHQGFLTAVVRRAEALQAPGVFRKIDRQHSSGIDVDALRAARHVQLDVDVLPLEIRPELLFGLAHGRGGAPDEGQKGDGSAHDRLLGITGGLSRGARRTSSTPPGFGAGMAGAGA